MNKCKQSNKKIERLESELSKLETKLKKLQTGTSEKHFKDIYYEKLRMKSKINEYKWMLDNEYKRNKFLREKSKNQYSNICK